MNRNKKPKKLKLEELERPSLSEFKNLEKLPITVVLDNIRSMHNVGSIFRTSDAFLVEQIILCGITPQPPHREITKAALGATESVEWIYEKNIEMVLLSLKEKEYTLVGLEQTDESISLESISLDKKQKYALVYGNEVDGISNSSLNLYDFFVEIPQKGTKHSLNVSVSVGISLWEFFKQLS